ncbi:hypothetical protein F5X96DRAFT_104726 [Biscogniauxia mediterranea]|nr:hypothetical protein F5X96DRAFT_104726 [Biscogniauxia mediterranea]
MVPPLSFFSLFLFLTSLTSRIIVFVFVLILYYTPYLARYLPTICMCNGKSKKKGGERKEKREKEEFLVMK